MTASEKATGNGIEKIGSKDMSRIGTIKNGDTF